MVNVSFGYNLQDPTKNTCTEPATQNDPFCVAIQQAQDYRVVLVAAGGNSKATYLTFLASDPRVVSVGGLQITTTGSYEAWNQFVAFDYPPLSPSRVSPAALEVDNNGIPPAGLLAQIFAPARDILSAMYNNFDWSPDYRCGTSRYITPFNPGLYTPALVGDRTDGFVGSETAPYGRNYGVCTGTSMAAPHVAGVVALIRSANPLLTTADTKSILLGTAAATSLGLPYPNAHAAVQSAINTNTRLTPLFSFYSLDDVDFLQTSVPQMGAAALMGGMLPAPKSGARLHYGTFSSLGNVVSGYGSFLDGAIPLPKGYSPDNFVPRARLRIFTTPRDALGTTLVPLFRLSYVNPDLSATSIRVRHYIAAGQADRDALSPAIWAVDGVEGYVYSVAERNPLARSVSFARMTQLL